MSAPTYTDSHTTPGKGRQYDEYYGSDPWARYLWSREQEVLAQALDEFLGGRSVRALDFACGTGRICSFLESRVASCSGVDVSEAMLGEARNCSARRCTARTLMGRCPFERSRSI
jgi:SAM-dependent methyltransferase